MFGTFSLYEGRDAYSLVSVEVQNYFREITENMEAACYGSYFLEFAEDLADCQDLPVIQQRLFLPLQAVSAGFPVKDHVLAESSSQSMRR